MPRNRLTSTSASGAPISGRTGYTIRTAAGLANDALGLLLLIEVSVLARGEAAYGRFLAWLQSPAVLALNAFVLLALLFHTFTWLNLAPRALVLRVGKRRVPDALVLVAHYSAWIAASALLAWLILRR